MTDDPLKTIVEGIEAVEVEERTLRSSKRDYYTRAKMAGFNTKALRKVIAEGRMKDREQVESDTRAYRIRLGRAVNDVTNGSSLRKAEAKHGIPKSTIQRHRAVPREEKTEMGQPVEDDSPGNSGVAAAPT